MFAPRVAFLDLETTGMTAARDAITEIGIVRVECDAADPARASVREWSTLVDPGQPIPPAIQALTGITDAMVRQAPPFHAIAEEVASALADSVVVAHNARFDYGFLKHAFARAGRRFSARVLCTVKLSRRLYPEAQGHGLDALIARHALPCPQRHRALGDARALWAFVQALYRERSADDIAIAVKRTLRTPSLPAHVSPDVIDALPEAPGVYVFYGLNAHPLYVGKSRNLRERVAAHFSSDWRSATDLRLSAEVQRIEHEQTAGEIGALLRESTLVKALMPAHNHALRRKAHAGVLEVATTPSIPRYVATTLLEPRGLAGHYGPFGSRAQARAALQALAREHRLCWTTLGLERRSGPCFARMVARCDGVCVGEESPHVHQARVLAALEAWRIPAWPYPGIAVLYERSEFGDRIDAHLLRDWCWLGTARDESELGALIETPPRAAFDLDVARLLMRTFARKRATVVPVSATARVAYAEA